MSKEENKAISKPPLDVRVVEHFKKDDLVCAICLGILNNPRQCKSGHMFCENCIKNAIQARPACPQCRCSLTVAELCRNLYVEKCLNSVMVYCMYHYLWDEEEKGWIVDDKGCKEVHEFQEIETHEKNCGFIPRKCPYGKIICGNIRIKDLEEHKRKCDFRPVVCQFCNLDVQAIKQNEHYDVCTSVPVPCPLCQMAVPRGETSAHLQLRCLENLIPCPFGCKEKLYRKNLKLHVAEKLEEHLESLRTGQIAASQTVEAALMNEIKARDKEIMSLKQKVKCDAKTLWVIDWGKQKDKGYIQSKSFRLQGFDWFLGLYPSGDKPGNKGNVAIYLMTNAKKEDFVKPLLVDFKFVFLNHLNSKNHLRMDFSKSFPAPGLDIGWGEMFVCKTEYLCKENGFILDDKLHIEAEFNIRQETLLI